MEGSPFGNGGIKQLALAGNVSMVVSALPTPPVIIKPEKNTTYIDVRDITCVKANQRLLKTYTNIQIGCYAVPL